MIGNGKARHAIGSCLVKESTDFTLPIEERKLCMYVEMCERFHYGGYLIGGKRIMGAFMGGSAV